MGLKKYHPSINQQTKDAVIVVIKVKGRPIFTKSQNFV